ncbi:ribose 5-phosphate isomerase B [Rhodovarius crocodyli]|uniref:Ribose 5-phosphate isomerase B n=1 Tax=Rhodovarius crocodyli TaxID=1979269 RepID=A0A437M296_9PROT|nr:ribose 5-phosphate isomerase B [Rhodovarius crocodyli]RVT91808.1 ribose 5-phosphate isomerase B [Rhodovarius crocodyli]
MTELRIAIGADHGGVELKSQLIAAMQAAGHQVRDFGTDGTASVDYPDYAAPVTSAVLAGEADFGVLVCGSGIGMQISANRRPGIRATVLHNGTEARLTRAHNNANVACFGGRTIGVEVALDALKLFLSTPYEGGRHDRRLEKIERPVA